MQNSHPTKDKHVVIHSPLCKCNAAATGWPIIPVAVQAVALDLASVLLYMKVTK